MESICFDQLQPLDCSPQLNDLLSKMLEKKPKKGSLLYIALNTHGSQKNGLISRGRKTVQSFSLENKNFDKKAKKSNFETTN